MLIKLKRFLGGEDVTLGMVTIDGEFVGFTCEDESRVVKVANETRIPAGSYVIGIRKGTPMSERYDQKFSPWHDGMLEIKNVPDFTNIYFHIGNTEADTSGCVLVGLDCNVASDRSGGYIGESTRGYELFYKVVRDSIKHNEDVILIIEDEDHGTV